MGICIQEVHEARSEGVVCTECQIAGPALCFELQSVELRPVSRAATWLCRQAVEHGLRLESNGVVLGAGLLVFTV